ncbi:hypothetical protein DL763_003925 [Monosporascus cannonballus]|nr:hypothetical protein DL763_003925 [Monosporascus cannonballus]
MPRKRMRDPCFLDRLFFGTSSFSRPARRERYIVPVYYPSNPGGLESATPGNEQPQRPKKVHFASPEPSGSDDTAEDSSTRADDSTGSDTVSGSEDAAESESDTPPPTDKKATAGNSADAKMKKDKSGSKAKSKDKAQGKAKDQDRAKGKQQQEEKGKDRSKREGDEGNSNKKEKKRKRRGRKVVLYIPDSDSSESSEESSSSSGSDEEDEKDEKDGKDEKDEKDEKEEKDEKAEKAEDAAKEEDSSSRPFDFPEEYARSKEYFYRHVLAELYPDRLRIEPDGEFWSADDCAVLATLEARQRALRWKHLQSEFHNATGRMVPLDLLKAKVESAEELR